MKPTQTVHPFHFGDPFRKSTSLWLRGLKPLIPTNIVDQREPAVHNMWPGKDRDKLRAKTYPGIATAMAEQWGGHIGCDCEKPYGNPRHISNYCQVHNDIPFVRER